MIDKLELRVPHFVPYTTEFSKLYQELRSDPKGPFRSSQHYLAVADLRDHGYPVLLHTHNVHDEKGCFKLELVETGGKSYRSMAREIGRIFETDTGPLEVMRLDLAADVPDVPVAWFQKTIRAQFKRWTASIGKLDPTIEFSEMGRSGVETLYFGRRPNVFRIYNKVAERVYRYAQMMARARKTQTLPKLPPFEEVFGHPAQGVMLTRVERQIAGSRFPVHLGTFRKLLCLAEIDPFERLVYGGIGKAEPNPDHYDLTQYLAGIGLRDLIERDGIHRVRQFLNKHSQRNASRLLRDYADFLPVDECLVDPKGLRDRFRSSVSKQLAA